MLVTVERAQLDVVGLDADLLEHPAGGQRAVKGVRGDLRREDLADIGGQARLGNRARSRPRREARDREQRQKKEAREPALGCRHACP